jgi:predicted ATPase/signal transduction histidine kinase/CheY-like chemotaxis protein
VVTSIYLRALQTEDIQQLIADSIGENPDNIQELADLILQKTQGNPFSVKELLKRLYSKKLIRFEGSWQWDKSMIEQETISRPTDIPVALFDDPPDTSASLLNMACCLDEPFTEDLLARLLEQNITTIQQDLEPLLKNEILWKHDRKYGFVNDRVKEALYLLIPEEKQIETHCLIRNHMQHRLSETEVEANCYLIANQLNPALSLINDAEERQFLAEINLQAGCKAKKVGAFEAAFQFLSSGLEILSDDCWENNYDLALALNTGMAEVAQLNGHDETMHKAIIIVRKKARQSLDRIPVTKILIAYHNGRNEFEKAIEIGSRTLKTLGVNLPQKPTRLSTLPSLIKAMWLIGRQSEVAILSLPKMTNPRITAAMSILETMSLAAFYTNLELYVLVILKAMTLTSTYGVTPFSSTLFVLYGSVLDIVFYRFSNAPKYGELGLKLARQMKLQANESSVNFLLGCSIIHWTFSLSKNMEFLNAAYLKARQSGDVQTSALSLGHLAIFRLSTGENLNALEKTYREYGEQLQNVEKATGLVLLNLCRQWMDNHRIPGSNPGRLSGPYFDENTLIPTLIKQNNYTDLCTVFVVKSNLLYHYREYAEALKFAEKAQKTVQAIYGHYTTAIHTLYYSLTVAAAIGEASLKDRKRFIGILRKNQKTMKKWADRCPQNYRHMYYLMKAETCRVMDDHKDASIYYNQAILAARENGFTQAEALANERAGVYYLELNNEFVAQSYLNEAYALYSQWGAIAKTEFLEREHPSLFSATSAINSSASKTNQTTTPSEFGTDAMDRKSAVPSTNGSLEERDLEQVQTLVDEFLANASAQLRNPLDGIIGITDTLLNGAKGEITDTVQSDLSLMFSTAKGLSKILVDILDFNSLKNQQIELQQVPIDLHHILEVALHSAERWKKEKEITINNSIDVDTPLVFADENRLQQILFNLVDSALKNNHSGVIDISAKTADEMVSVTITDIDVKITNAHQQQIFDPAAPQVETTPWTHSGLWLYITKNLIELHGGSLTVESFDHSESTFTFTLPIAQQSGKTKAAADQLFVPAQDWESYDMIKNPFPEIKPTIPMSDSSHPLQQTILIVNDDPIALQYLVNELALQDYCVQVARDGFEALELLTEELPDLILMDLIMPRMNGYELCRRIRVNHDQNSLPIVMLIAKARTEDIVRALQFGANDYLTKPFKKEYLAIRIQNQLAVKKTAEKMKEIKYLKKELFLKEESAQQLKATQHKLTAILDHVNDPILFFEKHFIITHLNKKAETHFGYTHSQLAGKRVKHLFPDIEEKIPGFANIFHWLDEDFDKWNDRPVDLTIQTGDQKSFVMPTIINKLDTGIGEFSIILSQHSRTVPLIPSVANEKQKNRKKLIVQDDHFRDRLVGLMQQSLKYWEAATGLDKFDLAEQSGLWKVQIDQGSVRTRTLDKYLDKRQLTKNPRWKDVLKTARFVLENAPHLPGKKLELETETEYMVSLLSRNKMGSHV